MKAYYKIILVVILNVQLVAAQSYRVFFTDKGDQSLSDINPTAILSADALARRAARNISLDEHDLPVAREYRSALIALGLEEQMHSRWLNYVKVSGVSDRAQVSSLPFVKRIEPVTAVRANFANSSVTMADSVIYGFSGNQIEMLNGQYLHKRGNLGQGMRIAVLDGGFQGTKNLPGLDSLWADGRVIDAKSFIATDTNLYSGGSHGTLVLSVLAGYIDSLYVGSAWKADYYLYRTEFEPTETAVEMDNWVAAAERADSLGVDIITSSLGYTTFDDGVEDYNYLDLDGNTTVVTRAADLAASRGILVVVSAGNLGDAPWQYISAPADGDSVMAVGGVAPDGTYASFSSWGPTSDGRIKPDVSAQGVATALLTPAGVSFGNGTSFSCPIISGLAACLWQNQPSLSSMAILEAIRSSASQSFTPDNRLGFGLANFRDAQWIIAQTEFNLDYYDERLRVYPNPSSGLLQVDLEGIEKIEAIRIYSMDGVLLQNLALPAGEQVEISLPAEAGIYLLSVHTRERIYLRKIIRQ